MKHYSKLFKRAQAWVLTIAMLLPLVNSGLLLGISAADETLPVRDKVVTTEGKIVADNYELSEAEEALLASGLLVGKTISIEKPNDTDELISVDSDTHAIKAVEFPDENGYVWKPVAARIMVGEAEKETVELINGEGTYEYDGNAFSVHVDYEVRADVSIDVQTNLWNAAAILKDGLAYLQCASDANMVMDELASDEKRYDYDGDGANDWSAMEVLGKLADGKFPFEFQTVTGPYPIDLGFSDEAAKEAVHALLEQIERNETAYGKKTFDLCLDVEDYNASASKVQYLVNRDSEIGGARFNSNFSTAYVLISNTLQGLQKFKNTVQDTAAMFGMSYDPEALAKLETVGDVLQRWLNKTKTAYNAESWAATTTDIVRANLTADEWAKLDSLVSAIDIMTPAPAEFKTNLWVATTTVKHNMSMFDVTVKVSLNLTTGNGESYAPYDKIFKTATVTLAENATKDEILAAIAATGVEDAAINAWIDAGVYVAGQFNTAGAVGVPETLTKDTHVSITYSPNKYTVELQYNGETKELLYEDGEYFSDEAEKNAIVERLLYEIDTPNFK